MGRREGGRKEIQDLRGYVAFSVVFFESRGKEKIVGRIEAC